MFPGIKNFFIQCYTPDEVTASLKLLNGLNFKIQFFCNFSFCYLQHNIKEELVHCRKNSSAALKKIYEDMIQ